MAGLIRDYIARERMSREQFAFRTKLGKSTVDKLLVGLFSDRTLAIVEAQTGLPLRAPAPPEGGAGPRPGRPELCHEVTFHRSSDGVNLAIGSAGEGPVVVKTANWLNRIVDFTPGEDRLERDGFDFGSVAEGLAATVQLWDGAQLLPGGSDSILLLASPRLR